jgi:hypothetical protein
VTNTTLQDRRLDAERRLDDLRLETSDNDGESGDRRRGPLAIAGLTVLRLAVALPYLLRGPKLFRDDFAFSAAGRFGGVWQAAGRFDRLGRPVGWLINCLQFGVIGPHPLVLYLFQSAVGVAVVVTLFLVARRFLPEFVAVGVAAMWALLPNHSSIDHWASQAGVLVGLLLFLVGVHRLVVACDRGRSGWPAVVWLAASCACYEATIPMAMIAVVVVPLVIERRVRARLAVGGVASLGALTGWTLTHSWRVGYHVPVPKGWADVSLVVLSNFGAGIAPSVALGSVVFVVSAVAIALALVRFSRLRGQWTAIDWMVPAGLAIIVVGTIPFVKFPISVYGMNDRANVVSSVGAATVWVGLLALMVRYRLAVAASAVALALLVVPSLWQRDRNYWRAGTDAEQTVRAVEARFAHPRSDVVVGPTIPNRGGVVGADVTWAVSAALEVSTGDRSAGAVVAPDPAAFDRSPPDRRIDLRTVLAPSR